MNFEFDPIWSTRSPGQIREILSPGPHKNLPKSPLAPKQTIEDRAPGFSDT